MRKVVETLIRKKGLKGIVEKYRKTERILRKLYEEVDDYILLVSKTIGKIFNEDYFYHTLLQSNLEKLVFDEKNKLF